MKEIIKLSLILGFVCVLAGASLSLVYQKTKPIIDQNSERRLKNALTEVLPNAEVNPEPIVEGALFETLKNKSKLEKLYQAKRSDGTVVYAAFINIAGYQGVIKALVGFDPTRSEILGANILEHSETPGLGARVAEEETDHKTFLDGLIGKLKDRDDYDTITGATISSQAVIDAIVSVVECGSAKKGIKDEN